MRRIALGGLLALGLCAGACSSSSGGGSGDGDGSGATSNGSSDTSGSGSASGTTGLPPGDECRSDEDCTRVDDCCNCLAHTADPPPNFECLKTCEETQCVALGLGPAQCQNGNCVLEKLDCDASKVLCQSLPPDCGENEVPSVEGECWTGKCVPLSLCKGFVYFDCEECSEGEACVAWQWWVGDTYSETFSCEPVPDGCGDPVDCDCLGDPCDAWPGYFCRDRPTGPTCCAGPDGDLC